MENLDFNRSPIAWMGGKFNQRKRIISLFPDHKVYVEVFGGAGHILFAKPPAKIEIFNDINNLLVNFFLVAREKSDILVEQLDSLLYSRQLFQQWKNEPLPDDPLEKAVRWFYILQSSYAKTYGGGWNSSIAKSSAKSYYNNIKRINNIKHRFKNVAIECIDFRKCIPKYDSNETLFYVDPPYDIKQAKNCYYNKSHNNFIKKFTEQDHIDLSILLNNIKGKCIISYYPTDLIKELYPDIKWHWIYHKVILRSQKKKKGEKREHRTEAIITNYTNNLGLFEN